MFKLTIVDHSAHFDLFPDESSEVLHLTIWLIHCDYNVARHIEGRNGKQ